MTKDKVVNLKSSNNFAIKEMNFFKPKAKYVSPSGKIVIEFPQMITGYVSFKINANQGDLIKIKFAEKVISLANISTNLQVSGVVKYTNNFEEEINWREELSYTKQISIVFTYGATWRVHNRKALKDFLEDGGEIKVFLPNPDNKSNMDILDQRFNYESGKTAEKIREAIKFFISLKNESLNNKLELKLYKYTFQNSYYMMDNYAIMAPFNHLIKQGEVPALKGVKNGALYDFIKKEIEAIEYQSDPYS